MPRLRVLKRISFVLSVLSFSILSGCASKGGDIEQLRSTPVESIISSSDQALASGDRERALSLLDTASKAHPTSPQPWVKRARIYFEAENYPSAILAAEEALQRDSANDEAGAIALVSSLRIAVKYVSDLRVQAGLTGDARPDGERLAAKLRETLKEPVLVPVEKPRPTKSISPAPKSAPRTSSPRPKPSGSESGSANPFNSLK